jgi:hypothetical protein
MPLRAPRRPPTITGPLSINRIRGALSRATPAELFAIAEEIGAQTTRLKTITAALHDEIERRHWPGTMLAAAA